MNLKQVRTNKTLIPLRQMPPLIPIKLAGGDDFKETVGNMMMLPESKGVKVLIVSGDPVITDFLQGLVEAHGYDTAVVPGFREAHAQVENGFAHVVFIDDSCLEIGNFKNFQLRTQELIQERVPVILLTNELMKQYGERLRTMGFFRIVRKPVGYIQISQVITDLMTE